MLGRHLPISRGEHGSALGYQRDPVDDIISHRCCSITLSNLEEDSHYSARHLQSLFRKKFGCTPMQFVCRRRLVEAIEQWSTGKPAAMARS